MDLVREPKSTTFEKKRDELQKASRDVAITVFGTSIFDESLYRAWSSIVHTLIPNAAVLSRHLTKFADGCSATEVILFERTTFLVIATSSPSKSTPDVSSSSPSSPASSLSSFDFHQMNPKRYERTSELVKAFKWSCSRVREEFHALEMDMYDFTAVLDEMTRNTYVMVVVHDPTIETAAIRLNIRMARKKFEELQGDSIGP